MHQCLRLISPGNHFILVARYLKSFTALLHTHDSDVGQSNLVGWSEDRHDRSWIETMAALQKKTIQAHRASADPFLLGRCAQRRYHRGRSTEQGKVDLI